MIIIPIPPSHCRIALQSKILFGISFKFEIIVDPVVVIPDILSKNALVKEKSKSEKMNGRDPNIAMLNQDRAVRRNACCSVSALLWSKFDKKNNVPKIIVTSDAPKNEESISE
tara:strand:+ start:616 stop:954 length:339 start_codon:yes stop_codon:yes gene_type:complete